MNFITWQILFPCEVELEVSRFVDWGIDLMNKFNNRLYICRFLLGDSLSHLDCEVLPKLHHVRVAASILKSFYVPSHLVGIWRYLNNAYNDDIFHKSCPPDQEIVLHWASRPDTPKLSYELYASLTRNTPRFSFDVPAVAIPINI